MRVRGIRRRSAPFFLCGAHRRNSAQPDQSGRCAPGTGAHQLAETDPDLLRALRGVYLWRSLVSVEEGARGARTKSMTKERSLPTRRYNRRNVMVTVKEKTTVTQRIRGTCPTHSRTEISVRDVRTVIDEPKEREGTNMGPTPTETMVAALIACTNVISHKCAKKHGVELKAMTMYAESTLDRRGTQLLEEIEVPFPKIRLLIDVTTDASEVEMEKVKADLHRFCPISKVVRNSGTALEEVWNVTRR